MIENKFDPHAATKRNCRYIKSYLAKPMTVILAVLYTILAFIGITNFSESADAFDVTSELMSKEYPFLSFCMTIVRYTQLIFPILIAIGLFVLFFSCQNRTSDNAPIGGLNTFFSGAVFATICYLALSLLITIILYELFNLLSEVGSQLKGSARSDVNTALLILLALVCLLCDYAASFTRFAASVKSSATSPSLYANGAVPFAVANFLLAFAIVFSDFFLSTQLGDFSNLLFSDSEATFSTILSLSVYVTTGIFALFYKSHITLAGDGGINIPEFTAPTTHFNTVSSVKNTSAAQSSTYSNTAQSTQKTNNFCTACGNKLNPQNKFCGKCGAKID